MNELRPNETSYLVTQAKLRVRRELILIFLATVGTISLVWFYSLSNYSKLDLFDQLSLFIFGISSICCLALGAFLFLSKEIERTLAKILSLQSKQLDEQKNIAQQAAKMSALGEMMGGLAHEINTPLAAIKLFLNQAIDEIGSDVPDLKNLNEFLHKSDLTVDRIAKIIKGLKTFSRAGQSDPFIGFSVQEAIEDAMILCEERFKKEQVDLRWSIPPETIKIDCRPIELTQVIINLIGNAIDAIASSSDKWIELHVSDFDSCIQIRVTDSGWGIPLEMAEKIFQPFFTTKEVGKGTGIGLSISHGIVKGHNGKLFVDTSLNNTSFVIELPKIQLSEAGAA